MEHLSESMLLQDTSFICEFVSEMANSFVIPIPKEIPDNMKEEIDKYYGRDLKKKEEEDKKA